MSRERQGHSLATKFSLPDEGRFVGGVSSSFPEGDDEAAGDDEGASDPDRGCWGLVEAELGDHLGYDEEEGDVDAEELAEVPLREVDEEAVEGEDGDA